MASFRYDRDPLSPNDVGGFALYELTAKPDRSRMDRRQTQNRSNTGGFTHAIASKKGRDLSFANLQTYTKQNLALAIRCFYVGDFKDRTHTASSPR